MMPHVEARNPTARLTNAFTSTLGSSIAPRDFPRRGGSLGLWMTRSDRPNQRYAVTCRHVLDPDLELTNRGANQDFEFDQVGRHPVAVLMPGDETHENLVRDMAPQLVDDQKMILGLYERTLAATEDNRARESLTRDIESQKARVKQGEAFRDAIPP